MNIDKIIHDKFITLLDKETINNISLLKSFSSFYTPIYII